MKSIISKCEVTYFIDTQELKAFMPCTVSHKRDVLLD